MNLIKNVITFREKPVTKAEEELARLIRKLLDGFNAKDQEVLYSVFHPDAKLCETLRERRIFLDRNEYIKKFMSSTKARYVSYKDVLIRVRNENEAYASYACHILFKDSSLPRIYHRNFTFIKQNGSWFVAGIYPT